jgi:hypothetical protein
MTATLPATPPRFATPRSPDRPTSGELVARLSRAFGRPFMPWQRQASDLLNERRPDGRRAHPFAVVTVPRQAGKTTWLLGEAVERCLMAPGSRVWYTAQNGQYAREKWRELVDELRAPGNPLAGRLRVKLTGGGESATFPNGSVFRPFAPTRDALHGQQSDLVILDEAWTLASPGRGDELMQAIGPTQATRPGAQVVVVSTAGALNVSTFLKPLVDRGRAGDPSLAYLEWSIADDVDPFDLDAVAAAHPAVGWTIDRTFLDREAGVLADLPGEYARAYGNRWTKTLERAIDPAVWVAAATTRTMPPGRVVFAADIAQDQSRGAILACNGGILEVIESRPGTGWVADRLRRLVADHRPAAVVVDRVGPSSTVADDLLNPPPGVDPVELFPLPAGTYAAACSRFLDDITHRRVGYRIHPALDAAVEAAAVRPLGEGWAWARRTAAAPICELIAATLASWADRHRPAVPIAPAVWAQ